MTGLNQIHNFQYSPVSEGPNGHMTSAGKWTVEMLYCDWLLPFIALGVNAAFNDLLQRWNIHLVKTVWFDSLRDKHNQMSKKRQEVDNDHADDWNNHHSTEEEV